jgi:peptidoglycan/xylan/chitin deacetylase (PgdA/CDA1 family)
MKKTMPLELTELLHRESPPPAPAATALALRVLRHVGFLGHAHDRLSILIFHRVLPAPDPLFPDEVDARRFDQLLALLKTCFNIVPLSEGVRGLKNGKLPPRAACITFDDGYADNAEIALPLLQKHGVKATFFVATGFLDGGRMFNDSVIETVRRAPDALDLRALGLGELDLTTVGQRRAAIGQLLGAFKYLPLAERLDQVEALRALAGVTLPDDLMMASSQVRQLHQAGMDIGGHTVNHPILARMDEAGARAEMGNGKEALEALLGEKLGLFAYPNGRPGQDYRAVHAKLARDLGFEAAVVTSWGAARPGGDLFQLPRFTPWDRTPLRFMLRMLRNLHQDGQRAQD